MAAKNLEGKRFFMLLRNDKEQLLLPYVTMRICCTVNKSLYVVYFDQLLGACPTKSRLIYGKYISRYAHIFILFKVHM